MIAFDSKIGVPSVWSLAPEDTLALVFWTKDPRNLIASQLRLEPYNVVVHVTATGWGEVEKGAPTLEEAGRLLVETSLAFSKVRWRFSPIPLLPDQVVVERFKRLLEYAERAKLTQVFVSFLQSNDLIREARSGTERFELLNRLADLADPAGIQVLLCQDDRSLDDWQGAGFGLAPCVPMSDFEAPGRSLESCECVAMVDPFTANESCAFACAYCYSGDKALSPRKRNSLRGLSVVR